MVVEISCVEVWQEVSDFIDHTVDPVLRKRMEAHFKVCEHCTAVLDGTRNIIRLVGDGHVFDLPRGFGQRLRVALARKIGS